MDFLKHNPTPVLELAHPVAAQYGVRILVLREDLNHPTVSGNKWWKLKYNLLSAVEQNLSRVVTFGGAYSNHIYATAAACSHLGLRSWGIIRGEPVLPLNPTLSFARDSGMELEFISREEYRSKNDAGFLAGLKNRLGDFYLIPEGGTNDLAVKGCAELYHSLAHISFDKLFVPVGTGGTLAGLVAGSNGEKEIVGVAVLKNGSFLADNVRELLAFADPNREFRFRLLTDYHFGGYAKADRELMAFMEEMKAYDLPLDHVYTAKMFFGLFDQIRKGYIPRGETVLAIHTGGLQGSRSLMNSSV
jgi:1-aminocyclopropane-1-carboxylate deaminase